jgi:hypothetical protein
LGRGNAARMGERPDHVERKLGGTPARILNRFVLLPDAELSMPEDEEPVHGAVVFVYIDHECGTSASLVSRARGAGDDLQLYGERYFEPECMSIQIFRYGAFPLANAVPLSEEQVSRFGLAVPEGTAEIYGFDDHEWQRRDVRLDSFRSESNPDDVLVLFPREDEGVEEIWVRLELPFPTEEFEGFRGTLLNQPFDPDSYVNVGDPVVLRLFEAEDDPMLVLVGKVHLE